MNLKELIKKVNIIAVKGDINIEVDSLCQDTKNCKKGCLFFCLKGKNNDSHLFLQTFKNCGVSALIVERFIDISIPQILVKNTRKIMPMICNLFYGNVLKDLKLIGVTGTNGKTTTTTLIYNILSNSKKQVGLIGTNGVKFGKTEFDTDFTTPDTILLFEIFDIMRRNKIEYVVMEISAHAIDLNKIYGLKFEIGIFTNLTQDHLDYFKTMHKYALTKLKFLQKFYCKKVIINIDDEYGKLFYKISSSKVFSYGIDNPAQNFALDLKLALDGSEFTVNILDEVLNIKTDLICKFNVYNILASIICSRLLGIEMPDIVCGIKNTKKIDGRVNFFRLKNGAFAIIDYAHTPDGLYKVLCSLREMNNINKIICVFGCGGNRDKSKRIFMGEIVSSFCDEIILTNDNPRFENPREIINDISQGINKDFVIEMDRTIAIKKAIDDSKNNDIVLIAGKGCEKYQEINGIRYYFSDYDILKDNVSL